MQTYNLLHFEGCPSTTRSSAVAEDRATCFATRNDKVTFELTEGYWYSYHSIGRT